MKYFELELNGKVIRFRLTTSECISLEEKNKCKMLDFIRDYSHTTLVTLLQSLRKAEVPNFSKADACNLMDELIDNGYTLETILYDVIYKALVVSGFLTKEELDQMKKQTEELLQTAENEQKQIIQK
jgi:hypothetical protein